MYLKRYSHLLTFYPFHSLLSMLNSHRNLSYPPLQTDHTRRNIDCTKVTFGFGDIAYVCSLWQVLLYGFMILTLWPWPLTYFLKSFNLGCYLLVIVAAWQASLSSDNLSHESCPLLLSPWGMLIIEAWLRWMFVVEHVFKSLQHHLLCPGSNDLGHIVLSCLFVGVVNFGIRYNFWTILRDRDLIFCMHTPLMMSFQMSLRQCCRNSSDNQTFFMNVQQRMIECRTKCPTENINIAVCKTLLPPFPNI